VKTSVLLEINRACNTILPVEDGIDAPERSPSREPVSWVRSAGPADVTIFFDFDNDFLSLHATTAVQRIAEQFKQTGVSSIEVTAFRGASKLSNGSVMVEQQLIAAARAAKVREILVGLGVPEASLKVNVISAPAAPDGVNDPWSRKVTLSVKK
jgi:outer membrane protein OmpA-like peptidoglycan-associated protein